ncbi:hypothetical protein TNIN_332001, partial [Trichonephila inaurata madagascariensis]
MKAKNDLIQREKDILKEENDVLKTKEQEWKTKENEWKTKENERPLPLAYSGTANREVAHLVPSTNRIARYQHTALKNLQRLFSSDECVIPCLLPTTPSILLSPISLLIISLIKTDFFSIVKFYIWRNCSFGILGANKHFHTPKGMKLILLILGVLTLNKVIICKANAPMIVSGETEEKHSANIGYQGKETLSSKDLKDVYDMAKNISHSKGSIVK